MESSPKADGPRRLSRGTVVAIVLGTSLFLVIAFLARFAVQVTAMRHHRATGPNWSFPSRVYSDAVRLETGRTLPEPYLLAELEARGYRRVAGPPLPPGTWARTTDDFLIGLRGFVDEPDPAGSGGPEIVRVRISDGRLATVERLGGFRAHSPPTSSIRRSSSRP